MRFFLSRTLVALTLLAVAVAPLRAQPMLLVDMETLEVLYEQDAGQPWYPASLTKLMTAFVTFEAIGSGKVGLDDSITISSHAASEPPSSSGLKPGSALTLRDALYVMIVKSANDVAMAIAERVGGSEAGFVALMNEAARRMGLTATHFVNPNGLHDTEQVTSARDLAVLALYLRQNFPQFRDMFETETVKLGKASFKTNNDLLQQFAGTTGMKTGYVCASGLNIVATVTRNGKSLIAVVLGGSSARERGEMAAEMFLRGFSGALGGTGKSLLAIANLPGAAADMRPLLCGKDAKAYVAERIKAFPYGLKGEPTYLTDDIEGRLYLATDLGVTRTGIALPRPRPAHVPKFADAVPPVAAPETEIIPAKIIPAGGIDAGSNDVGGMTPEGAPIPMPRPRPGLQQG